MDPMTLIMFALVGVLIIFMIRNSRKRQSQAAEMQSKIVPGAEVMLQSGIFAVIESIDEENNRATVTSGTSTIVVHRNAIGQVITPVDAVETEDVDVELAPDDDPEFGEHLDSVAQADTDQPATSEEIAAANDQITEDPEDTGSDKA